MKSFDNVRNSIIEFWRAALSAILIFALMVTGIFISSKVAWKKEQERLELYARQKAIEKLGRVEVSAFVNGWNPGSRSDRASDQKRYRVVLSPGAVYEIGRLREYDSTDVEKDEYGFDHVIQVATDDPMFYDPVITVRYANLIHVKYSVDNGSGWLVYGPTRRGIKGGEYLWTLPEGEERDSTDKCDGWLQKAITFTFPINGTARLAVESGDESVSEDMRGYNSIETERLGDVYTNVPEKFADRTRQVYTSHIFIEAWRADPRDWRTNGHSNKLVPTPEITILLRFRHYGVWNVTKDEYESMRYKVDEFSSLDFREFSPYSTIEHIGMLTKDVSGDDILTLTDPFKQEETTVKVDEMEFYREEDS